MYAKENMMKMKARVSFVKKFFFIFITTAYCFIPYRWYKKVKSFLEDAIEAVYKIESVIGKLSKKIVLI